MIFLKEENTDEFTASVHVCVIDARTRAHQPSENNMLMSTLCKHFSDTRTSSESVSFFCGMSCLNSMSF